MHSRGLTLVLAGALAAAMLVGVSASRGAGTQSPPDVHEFAAKILNSPAARFLSPGAHAALEMAAHGNNQFGQGNNTTIPYKTRKAAGGNGPKQSSFKNAIVNDPQMDTNPPYAPNQLDQTTQSETSIAVCGNNVVTGFNDSQQTLLFLTPGSNLSGYSVSTNKGQAWNDQATIPNRPGDINLGDPWLAADSACNFYYSTLYIDFDVDRFALDIGVAKSTDGGKTFSPPVMVDTQAAADPFYFGDKDSLAAGPGVGGNGNALYDSWDDFVFKFDPCCSFLSGLPVSHSYDGGQTWVVTYADQVPIFGDGCSFQQFIGANPFVTKNGTVFDAVERLFVNNPDCEFNPPPPFQREIDIYRSDDGGQTWGPRSVVSDVTESTPGGLFFLGPHKWMRNLEFPTTAQFGNSLYVAWNDGRSGHSHIMLARSDDGGATWATTPVADGIENDEIQPAMVGDSNGLHILYYVRNPDLTLDTYIDNSPAGTPTFTPQRVSTQSFPGVYTVPQFDPIIVFGYMGDYIGMATDGKNQYMAWGDNRDRITSFLYPQGRNDPDVFSAVQAP
jgi:hypothetical protein